MMRTRHAIVCAALLVVAPMVSAQETVGSRYKNIQVLTDIKDAPPQQLIDIMQFMSGSLSVSCNYCHVAQSGPFDSDANKKKAIARDMIRMVRTLNATSFGGKQVVTCNTCHRGSTQPVAVPTPWYKSAEAIAEYKKDAGAAAATPAPSSPPASGDAPIVEQMLDRYRKAVNGDGLKSVRFTGVNIVGTAAAEVPFTAEAIFPDRFAVASHQAGGDTRIVLSGGRGWRITPKDVTDMIAAQEATTRATYQLFFRPVKIESSPDRHAAGTAQIDGVTCLVLQSTTPALIERFYVDAKTGLLKKIRREVPTPLGVKVEERVFDEYRPENGIMLPHVMSGHYMEDQSEIRISKIEINPQIDPATFERGGGS